VLQTDGKIVLLSYRHTSPLMLDVEYDVTRLNADATPDATFKRSKLTITGGRFYLEKLVSQPDGKILLHIARDFAIAGGTDAAMLEGVTRRHVARLNSNGSLDTAFDPNPKFGSAGDPVELVAFLVQLDGRIVVSGYFDHFDGVACDHLVRLNADGSRDAGFVYRGPPAAGRVSTMALDPDGKLLIGGSGTIMRLNEDGSVDERFDSSGREYMDFVSSIAVQPDRKVV
jgi:uncharacterized delta-60 repeat protein